MPDIEIVEVSPRDGFQSISAFIPTADKIAHIRALHAAGLRRIEATAFVSPSAVPQMADAHEVLATIRADLPNLDAQVLVPTARQTERALDAGAAHLVFVLSVSERHNWGNVRRSPQESAQEYAGVLALAGAQTKMRLNVATAFDCPYDGLIDRHQVFCTARSDDTDGPGGGGRAVRHDRARDAAACPHTVHRGLWHVIQLRCAGRFTAMIPMA
jgi:hydroxymethylglutaryl-CoA lyase